MSLRIYEAFKGLINIFLGLIAFFLVLRIIVRLFSANPQTPFVEWVLKVSEFLMTPFNALVPDVWVQTGILDIVAIITLAVYLLLGYLLLSVLQGLINPKIIDEYATHYHDIEKRK